MQPGVVVVGERHLEDELLVVLLHEQGDGRRPLPEDTLDDEPVRQAVAPLGVQGIGDEVLSRGGEFVLHVVEQRQEVLDRADAGEHVGVGAPLDQLFELRPRPVEHGGNGEALLLPQDLGEFGRVGRRWPVGEQVEGDGPEREHVRGFRHLAGVGDRLGRHVDEGLGLDQILDVRDPARGGGRLPHADLPVVDLKLRHRRRRIGDEDALRAQRPVDDPLAVGVADGVGDLPQHVQPLAGGQLRAVGRQIVIEPDGIGVEVAEQQGRAVLVLLVVEDRQDAGVVERLDDLELTSRRPLEPLAVLLRRGLGDGVLADPAEHVLERGVLGEPVLIARPVGDQVAQHVVADPPRPLRRADARLIHGSGQRLATRDVDGRAEFGVDARPVPVDEGGEDALPLGVVLRPQAGPSARPGCGPGR